MINKPIHLKEQNDVLLQLSRLKGLHKPSSINKTAPSQDYECVCGDIHNTKSPNIEYLAAAFPAIHLHRCAKGYITVLKQGLFGWKALFAYHMDATGGED